MVTINEMLNKKGSQKKPFKKISYKPWESSFLNEEDTSVSLSADEKNTKLNLENDREGGLSSDLSEPIPSFLQEGSPEEKINITKSSGREDKPQPSENYVYNQQTYVNQQSPKVELGYENINVDGGSADSMAVIEPNNVSNNIEKNNLITPTTESFLNQVPPPVIKKIDPNYGAPKPILQKRSMFRVQSLIGIPRLIMFELIKREEYRDDNFVYFEIVTTSELAELCNTTYNSLATSIARLKARGSLFSVEGKPGRGGYSVYSMPLPIFNEIEKWIAKHSG